MHAVHVVACGLVAVLSIVFYGLDKFDGPTFAKFENHTNITCIQKESTKWAVNTKFWETYGKNENYGKIDANVSDRYLSGIQEAAGCPQVPEGIISAVPVLASAIPEVCGCLKKVHDEHFVPNYAKLYSNSTEGIRAITDRFVYDCLFLSRFPNTASPWPGIQISPMCSILYISWAAFFWSYVRFAWGKTKRLADSVDTVVIGAIMLLSSFTVAILLFIRLLSPSAYVLSVVAFCGITGGGASMLAMKFKEKPKEGQSGYRSERVQASMCGEYCFTLTVLVMLYDMTQYNLDYLYVLPRILSSIALSLFSIFFVMEKDDAKQTRRMVWLLGAAFMAFNTPPAKMSSLTLDRTSYWTEGYIPIAFYLYTLGMPISICWGGMGLQGEMGHRLGMVVSFLTSLLLMGALASAYHYTEPVVHFPQG